MIEKLKNLSVSLSNIVIFLVSGLFVAIIYLMHKVSDLKSLASMLSAKKDIDKELGKLEGLEDESKKAEDDYNNTRNAYLNQHNGNSEEK